MSNTNSSDAQEGKEFFPFRALYQALDTKLGEIQEAWKSGDRAKIHVLHHEAIGILIDLSHGSFIIATNEAVKKQKQEAEEAANDSKDSELTH